MGEGQREKLSKAASKELSFKVSCSSSILVRI